MNCQSLGEMTFPSIKIAQNFQLSSTLNQDVCTRRVNPQRCSQGIQGPAVDHMLDTACKPAPRYRHKHRQALSAFLYQLLCVTRAATEPSQGVGALALPRRPGEYNTPSRYRCTEAGQKVWIDTVDALRRRGYVNELMRGYKTKSHMKGLSSAYEPTHKLRDWFHRHAHELAVVDLSHYREPVVLTKGPDKLLADYTESEQSIAIRNQLMAVASLFDDREVTLPDGDGVQRKVPVDFFKPRRIFRDDFHSGGRAYCRAQTIGSEQRKQLQVDGEPCVEWDYSSHQPRMLYHLNGLEAPEDCYAHATIPRDLIKSAMMRVMNCKNDKQARGALQGLLNESGYKLTARALLDAVYTSHPLIQKTMGADLWKQLQYLESSITMQIMERLADQNVCCLGVHDSFVVSQSQGTLLQKLMADEYQKQMGFWPILKQA